MNIVISGATKGIGKAIAQRFAAAGFNIVAIARTKDGLNQLATELNNQYPGIQVWPMPADLSKKEEVLTLAARIKSQLEEISILVNNAGLYLEGEVLTEPTHQLEQMLAVNLLAPYYLCRELVPMMDNTKGHIFNICSVASRQVGPRNASYAISKHGLLAFNRALRQELLDTAIRVTAVLPGPTYTASWEGVPVAEERLMPPEDVADAVWGAWQMSSRTVVEEIVLRPRQGDL